MKRILIAVLITFTILNYGLSQDKNDIVKDIRVKFKEINDYKSYQKIILNNEEFMEQMTDGGGQLTAYLKNDSIFKIYEFIGLSFGVRKTEYYYWSEKLFFAYQTEEVFNHIFHLADTVEVEMTMDEAYELIKTSEKRFYYHADTLVDLKKKGDELFGYDTDKEAIESILNNAKENLMIIRKQK